ncbi:unnamed protein product [Rotaria socialis]|uniref:Gem-associated protein 2 n=1 Tax=Rotaria socialis TaxID=392032 RepID=A0A817ZZJ9_9BILA|nr:unnamed protein product [Rotaria socialis]CAF3357372.1 unnamed protein product [Rotaria socialis]CAF3400492.1 unnamed protein product [Rotaria socialis]CAF3507288.1 unnamed protein product [Rotaria socialis]CAF4212370.1 unnamed protein product [Rotaria socialis]
MFENTDSSDDNDESLCKQVLPAPHVDDDPVDMNKVPTTGEEYLRQVRFQASQLPTFQAASKADKNLGTSASSKTHAWHKLFSMTTNTSSNVTEKHIVSTEWQNEQSLSFSNVRNDYFQMRDRLRARTKKTSAPRLRTANDYWKFCFDDNSQLSFLETDDQSDTQHPLPTMAKMIILSQPQLHQLLQHENDWLKQNGCSLHLALYMFATLAAVDKPISEDVIYTMRQTCTGWKEIRTKLLNSTDDDDHSVDSTLMKTCDLFICIIGRYFGQFDLADKNE